MKNSTLQIAIVVESKNKNTVRNWHINRFRITDRYVH